MGSIDDFTPAELKAFYMGTIVGGKMDEVDFGGRSIVTQKGTIGQWVLFGLMSLSIVGYLFLLVLMSNQ